MSVRLRAVAVALFLVVAVIAFTIVALADDVPRLLGQLALLAVALVTRLADGGRTGRPGTRNQVALGPGLGPDDVVGALDAYGQAVERPMDLADVNGSVFVNNVSLGLYATIVRSPEFETRRRIPRSRRSRWSWVRARNRSISGSKRRMAITMART